MSFGATFLNNAPRRREAVVGLLDDIIQSLKNLGWGRFEESEVIVAQGYQVLEVIVAGLYEFETDTNLIRDSAGIRDSVEC